MQVLLPSKITNTYPYLDSYHENAKSNRKGKNAET
jgi:hypothetical protein